MLFQKFAVVIAIDISVFVMMYLTTGFAVVLGLWVYYDVRDRSLFDRERQKGSFHCVRCQHLYSANRHSRAVDCPACGFANTRLKF